MKPLRSLLTNTVAICIGIVVIGLIVYWVFGSQIALGVSGALSALFGVSKTKGILKRSKKIADEIPTTDPSASVDDINERIGR